MKATTAEEFALLAETATNNLNHKPRRCLGGKTACRVYFDKDRIRYNKIQRKAVYEWIKDLAIDISRGAGQDEISCLAWRVAARKWLERNNLVTIIKPGKASPHFSLNLCYNQPCSIL